MEEQTSTQQPQQGAYPVKPDSHLGLAIFPTICCCWPLSIVAIIKASKVDDLYNAKQYEAAVAASNEAKKWSMYGIISGVIIWAIVIIFYFFIFGAAFLVA